MGTAWGSQPPDGLVVCARARLTEDLLAAWLPHPRRPWDAASGTYALDPYWPSDPSWGDRAFVGEYAYTNRESLNYSATFSRAVAASAWTQMLIVTPLSSITSSAQMQILAGQGGWNSSELLIGRGGIARISHTVIGGGTIDAPAYTNGKRYVVVAVSTANGSELWVDGELVGTAAGAFGNAGYQRQLKLRSPSATSGVVRYSGGAAWARRLAADEIRALSRNPWQIFARQRRLVVLGAGGGATEATISAAAGAATGGTISGSATAAAAPSAGAGSAGAGTLAGASTATAEVSAAVGVGSGGALVGASTAAAAVVVADGAATGGQLLGAAVTAATVSASEGVATAETLSASATASAAFASSSGVAVAATLSASALAQAAIASAVGAATSATISSDQGTATISAAAGAATTATLAGSATAAGAPASASGAAAASTIAASATAQASITPAGGQSTAATITSDQGTAAAATAAGAATTGTLSGSATASAVIAPAGGAASGGALVPVGAVAAERAHGFEIGGDHEPEPKPKRRGLVTLTQEPEQKARHTITKREIDRRVFEKAREEARAVIAKAAEQHSTATYAKAERFAQVRTALKPLAKALGDWNWIAVYQRMYQDALDEQIRQELAREEREQAAVRAADEADERELMNLIMEWM